MKIKLTILFLILTIFSCTKNEEKLKLQSYSLLHDFSQSNENDLKGRINYILNHNLCQQNHAKDICNDLKTLNQMLFKYDSITNNINLAKDDFQIVIEQYNNGIDELESIRRNYKDLGESEIQRLKLEDSYNDREGLLILMRASLINNKRIAFGIISNQIAID